MNIYIDLHIGIVKRFTFLFCTLISLCHLPSRFPPETHKISLRRSPLMRTSMRTRAHIQLQVVLDACRDASAPLRARRSERVARKCALENDFHYRRIMFVCVCVTALRVSCARAPPPRVSSHHERIALSL